MQTSAFQQINHNSVYLPFPVQENQLSNLLESFDLLGVQGFNVTVPYKEKIIPFLSDVSDEAAFVGAVNTVKKTPEGWIGYCTDGSGFVRGLSERNIELRSKCVLMIGAGGAAKAIAFSIANNEIAKLVIVNRTASKATALKSKLNKSFPKLQIVVNPNSTEDYDLLINTTTIGMDGISLSVPENQVNHCKAIVDIIYNPPQTPLLKLANEQGLVWANGIDMLLYQGAEAFEIWTNKKAPIEVMRKCLEKSLAFAK